MNDWKAKRQEMDAALKVHVIPVLRGLGFRGSYPHFRRQHDDRVETIGFQFSQWEAQFYIEIGVANPDGYTLLDGTHYPARSLKYYQCPVRERIGSLPFDFQEQPINHVAELAKSTIQAAQSVWERLFVKLQEQSNG